MAKHKETIMKDFKQGRDIMQLHCEKNHFSCYRGNRLEWGEKKMKRQVKRLVQWSRDKTMLGWNKGKDSR